jgi:hypothetical protein
MLDAYQAVLAARSYPGGQAAEGNTLLAGTSQLNATAAAGTTERLSDTVTNLGATNVSVGVSSRTLGAYRVVADKTPVLTYTNGNLAKVQFVVPATNRG